MKQDSFVGTNNFDHVTLTLDFDLFFNFNFVNNFELWELKLWYFTWTFHDSRPFCVYQKFWPCDLDLGDWPFLFWKTLTLLVTHSHAYSMRQNLSVGANNSYHACYLDLGVGVGWKFLSQWKPTCWHRDLVPGVWFSFWTR